MFVEDHSMVISCSQKQIRKELSLDLELTIGITIGSIRVGFSYKHLIQEVFTYGNS
jgi:hypothetical protein